MSDQTNAPTNEQRSSTNEPVSSMNELVASPAWSEAPASLNFYGVTLKGWNCQFTLRDGDENTLLERFAAFVAILEEKGVTPKPVGQQPAPPPAPPPSPDTAAQIARDAGNEKLAQDLQDGYEALPPAPDGKPWLYADADRLKILPQPGDLINMEFYRAGLEYPVIKVNKWKAPQAQGLVKYVTSQDVLRPAELSLACRVFYTEGKEYHYTDRRTSEDRVGRYKDVGHVRPR